LYVHSFFVRYVPPITSSTEAQLHLPDTPGGIEDEIRKQESLLAELHLQITAGAASKKTEEQIWEQQRIVTQLKVRI
jgi:RalA-binding protein 1